MTGRPPYLLLALVFALAFVFVQSVGATGFGVGLLGRVALNRAAVRQVQFNRVQNIRFNQQLHFQRFAQPVFLQPAPVRFVRPQFIQTQPVFIPQQFNYQPVNYGFNPPPQRVVIPNGHGCNDFFR